MRALAAYRKSITDEACGRICSPTAQDVAAYVKWTALNGFAGQHSSDFDFGRSARS